MSKRKFQRPQGPPASQPEEVIKIPAMQSPGSQVPDLSPGTDEGGQAEQPHGEGEAAPAPNGEANPITPEGGQSEEGNHGDLLEQPIPAIGSPEPAMPELPHGGEGQPEQAQDEGQAASVPVPEVQPGPSSEAGGQSEINHGDLFGQSLETLAVLGQDEYQELRLCGRRMAEHYWKFGQIVTAIKRKLEHGKFIEFCNSQGWDLHWAQRSMRIFRLNPTLDDCIGLGVIEACQYDHAEEEREETQPDSLPSAVSPPAILPMGSAATVAEEDGELGEKEEDLDQDEEEENLDYEDEDEDEDEEEEDLDEGKADTNAKAGTVYDPPKWMLHNDGSIRPINRETKDRYHDDKSSNRKRVFPKKDGVLFNTRAEAAAEFARRREEAPKYPNCERVLSDEEKKSHPRCGIRYIMNGGKVVRIDYFTPPGSANRFWYTWDGAAITEIDKDAISQELYGISTEQIPDADRSQQAKLLEGRKTYDVLVTLRGTIRLTGADEDEVKKILEADWKDMRHSITFLECEALDAQVHVEDENVGDHQDSDDLDESETEAADGDGHEAAEDEPVTEVEPEAQAVSDQPPTNAATDAGEDR